MKPNDIIYNRVVKQDIVHSCSMVIGEVKTEEPKITGVRGELTKEREMFSL